MSTLIGGLALVILLAGLSISLFRPSAIPLPKLLPEKNSLPKRTFEMTEEQYEQIGPPLLSLAFSPMSLQLPDLRNYLVYYGRNERPDANPEHAKLHFAFTGSKEVAAVAPEKPLYLIYDSEEPRVKYRFSPNDAPTSLWIEGIPSDKEAIIHVAMKNEAGEIIRKPEQYARFTIKEKEFTRFGGEKWEIGNYKVDGTLLARQRAKWYGKDLFLEMHGGEEYKEVKDKQKIEFGQDGETYSVFVGLGDVLAWKDNRWQHIEPGPDSQKYPLLVIKSIEDRLLRMELWDVDGKSKISLNLIKAASQAPPPNLLQAFKFVGARTRSQLMFEIHNERMTVSPKDWLLYFDKHWINLKTPKEIDDYVEGKTAGPLLVIGDILREDGKQVLIGNLYNSTRTEMKEIEIPLQQGASPQTASPRAPGAVEKKTLQAELQPNAGRNEVPLLLDKEKVKNVRKDAPPIPQAGEAMKTRKLGDKKQ